MDSGGNPINLWSKHFLILLLTSTLFNISTNILYTSGSTQTKLFYKKKQRNTKKERKNPRKCKKRTETITISSVEILKKNGKILKIQIQILKNKIQIQIEIQIQIRKNPRSVKLLTVVSERKNYRRLDMINVKNQEDQPNFKNKNKNQNIKIQKSKSNSKHQNSKIFRKIRPISKLLKLKQQQLRLSELWACEQEKIPMSMEPETTTPMHEDEPEKIKIRLSEKKCKQHVMSPPLRESCLPSEFPF